MFYELWKGTRADFDAIQGPKPYRKAYIENVKQFLEKVEVEWNSGRARTQFGNTAMSKAFQ